MRITDIRLLRIIDKRYKEKYNEDLIIQDSNYTLNISEICKSSLIFDGNKTIAGNLDKIKDVLNDLKKMNEDYD